MLIDDLANKKQREVNLNLMTPQFDSFGRIQGVIYESLEIEFRFDDYDILTFSLAKTIIPDNPEAVEAWSRKRDEEFGYQRIDPMTKQMVNPFWNRCENDYIIELEIRDDKKIKYDYFTIREVKVSATDKDVKEITARHYSQEFTKKILRNYKSEVNGVVTTKNIREIFNDINNDKMDGSWKLGYVDPDVELRYISVDVDEETVWDFFMEIKESLRCVYRFDISFDRATHHVSKVMNVYDTTAYPTCPVCDSSDVIYLAGTLECLNPDCGKEWNPNATVQVMLGNSETGEKKAYSFVLSDDPGNVVVPLSVDSTDALNSIGNIIVSEGSTSGELIQNVNLSSGTYTFKFTMSRALSSEDTSCNIKVYTQNSEDDTNPKLIKTITASDFRTGDKYYFKKTFDSPVKYMKFVMQGAEEGQSCYVQYNGMFNILDDYLNDNGDVYYDQINVVADNTSIILASKDIMSIDEANAFDGGWGFIVVDDASVAINGNEYTNQRGLALHHAAWTKDVYAGDTGLFITDKNYIKKFEEDFDATKLITRLYIYGKNNLPIRDVNPTGQDYIDDFSFYRGFKDENGWHSKYMTKDLLGELEAYDKQSEYFQGTFKQLLQNRNALQEQYSRAVVVSNTQQDFLEDLGDILSRTEDIMDDELSLSTRLQEAINNEMETFYWNGSRYTISEAQNKLDELQQEIIELNTDMSNALDDMYLGNIIEITDSTDIDLSDYSLNSLKEALAVVEARIDAVEEYLNTSDEDILSQELGVSSGWRSGDVIRLEAGYINEAETEIRTDKTAGSAEVSFTTDTDEFTIPWQRLFETREKVTSTSKPDPTLAQWAAKICQTDDDGNLQYIALMKKSESGESYVPMVYGTDFTFSSKSGGYWREVNYKGKNLLTIKSTLDNLIERKQAEVDMLQALLDANQKQIDDLSQITEFVPFNRSGDTDRYLLTMTSAGRYTKTRAHAKFDFIEDQWHEFRIEASPAILNASSSFSISIYPVDSEADDETSTDILVYLFTKDSFKTEDDLVQRFRFRPIENNSYMCALCYDLPEGASVTISAIDEGSIEYPKFQRDYTDIANYISDPENGLNGYETWVDKTACLEDKNLCLTSAAQSDILQMKNNTEFAGIIDEFVDFIIYKEQMNQELCYFIREDVYTNNDIGTSEEAGTTGYTQTQELLLRDGTQAFKSMSSPTYAVTVDIINFEKALNCPEDWGKLKLGEMVHIRHGSASQYEYLMRIMAVKWNPDSKTIPKITLSSQDDFKTPWRRGLNRIKAGAKATTALSVKSGTWDNSAASAVDIVVNDILAEGRANIASADNTVHFGNTGITVEGQYEENKGDQVRITKNSVALLKDGQISTAITPNGIYADRLIGNAILGKQLTIEMPKFSSDGCTQYMNMYTDENGLHVKNGGLAITKDALQDDENGIQLTPELGLLVTDADATSGKSGYMTLLNKDGLKLGTAIVTAETDGVITGIDWIRNNISIDKTGDALFNGTVRVQQLYIRDDNVEALIEACNNTNDEDIEYQITGKVINPSGLNIVGSNSSFSVDENAQVDIQNGNIHMITGDNELLIDPINFIKWIINGEAKFYYDSENDSLVFIGDIRASNIYGSKFYNEDGNAYVTVGTSTGNYGDFAIYNNLGQERFKIYDEMSQVQLKSRGITFLETSGSNNYMRGVWKYQDSEVATQASIDNLQNQINTLMSLINTNPTT